MPSYDIEPIHESRTYRVTISETAVDDMLRQKALAVLKDTLGLPEIINVSIETRVSDVTVIVMVAGEENGDDDVGLGGAGAEERSES